MKTKKVKAKKFTLRFESFHKKDETLSPDQVYNAIKVLADNNNDSVNQFINKQLQKLIK